MWGLEIDEDIDFDYSFDDKIQGLAMYLGWKPKVVAEHIFRGMLTYTMYRGHTPYEILVRVHRNCFERGFQDMNARRMEFYYWVGVGED